MDVGGRNSGGSEILDFWFGVKEKGKPPKKTSAREKKGGGGGKGQKYAPVGEKAEGTDVKDWRAFRDRRRSERKTGKGKL